MGDDKKFVAWLAEQCASCMPAEASVLFRTDGTQRGLSDETRGGNYAPCINLYRATCKT